MTVLLALFVVALWAVVIWVILYAFQTRALVEAPPPPPLTMTTPTTVVATPPPREPVASGSLYPHTVTIRLMDRNEARVIAELSMQPEDRSPHLIWKNYSYIASRFDDVQNGWIYRQVGEV